MKNLVNILKESKTITDKQWDELCNNIGIDETVELIKEFCPDDIQNTIYNEAKKRYNF